MSRIHRILILFILLIFTACVGSQNITDSLTEDSDVWTNDNLDDPDTPTSITTIGNPKLDIEITGDVFLTLDQDNDNFKQIADTTLSSVITFADPDLAVNTLLKTIDGEALVPGVKDFSLGLNAEVVVAFSEAVIWNEEPCMMLYSSSDVDLCVETGGFGVEGKVRFDAHGHVYYFGKDNESDINKLVKWDPITQSKTYLINQNITLTQWRVHADGIVYLLGEANDKSFFRRVNQDGSLENLLTDGSAVQEFSFIDETRIIFDGEEVEFMEGTYSGNFIYDITQSVVVEKLDFSEGNLTDLRIDSADNVYVQEGHKIYRIYPSIPTEVETGIAKIGFFELYDDVLYVVGQDDLEQKMIGINLETKASQTLIENSEVYHLKFDGINLIFDHLDFDDNQLRVSQLNVNTGAFTAIEELVEGVVKLESIFTAQNNYSFSSRTFVVDSEYEVVAFEYKETDDTMEYDSSNMTYFNLGFDITNYYYNRLLYFKSDTTFDNLEAYCLGISNYLRYGDYILFINCNDHVGLYEDSSRQSKLLSGQLLGVYQTVDKIIDWSEEDSDQKKMFVSGVVQSNGVPYRMLRVYTVIVQTDTIRVELDSSVMFQESSVAVLPHKKQRQVYVMQENKELKVLDSTLSLLESKELYFGTGTLKMHYRYDNLFVIGVSSSTDEDPYLSKILIIDLAERINHVLTLKFSIDARYSSCLISEDGKKYELIATGPEGHYDIEIHKSE